MYEGVYDLHNLYLTENLFHCQFPEYYVEHVRHLGTENLCGLCENLYAHDSGRRCFLIGLPSVIYHALLCRFLHNGTHHILPTTDTITHLS